jgi:hypothetical protein
VIQLVEPLILQENARPARTPAGLGFMAG